MPNRRRALLILLVLSGLLVTGCAGSDPSILNLFHRETATLPLIASARPTRTPTETATPFYTASPTVTPTLTATPVPIVTPTIEWVDLSANAIAEEDSFELLEDMTIPDGVVVERGALLIKSWRIRNTGKAVWTSGYRLVRAIYEPFVMPQSQRAIFLQPTDLIEMRLMTWNPRQESVAPGMTVDLVVPIHVPTAPGSYQIEYFLVNEKNELVGKKLWVAFEIPYEPGELTATVEEAIRLSATPDLNAETERSPHGTVMPTMVIRKVDWSGKWLIRNPFILENTIPIEAELSQVDDRLVGYFYDSVGEIVLIDGTLSPDRQHFTGNVGFPWDRKLIEVQWRLTLDGDQFSAITGNGTIEYGTSCGSRNGKPFPDYCAIPPGV